MSQNHRLGTQKGKVWSNHGTTTALTFRQISLQTNLLPVERRPTRRLSVVPVQPVPVVDQPRWPAFPVNRTSTPRWRGCSRSRGMQLISKSSWLYCFLRLVIGWLALSSISSTTEELCDWLRRLILNFKKSFCPVPRVVNMTSISFFRSKHKLFSLGISSTYVVQISGNRLPQHDQQLWG